MVPTSRPECDELRSLLPELLEEELKGSLPAGERERLLAHAGACSECAEFLRSYRSLLAGLSALPPVPAPAGFARGVREAIAVESGGAAPSGAAAARRKLIP